jgi:hypothetical protein
VAALKVHSTTSQKFIVHVTLKKLLQRKFPSHFNKQRNSKIVKIYEKYIVYAVNNFHDIKKNFVSVHFTHE